MFEEFKKRIEELETEVCYLHKDMAYLITLLESIEPEIHTHYTLITENITCKSCEEKKN